MTGLAGIRYTLAADVLLQSDGDDVLLANLHDETLFVLNATGAAVVQALTAGNPITVVIDQLAATYAVEPAAIAPDVQALVADLVERRLLLQTDQRN